MPDVSALELDQVEEMNCQIDKIMRSHWIRPIGTTSMRFWNLQEPKEFFFRAETKHLQHNLAAP